MIDITNRHDFGGADMAEATLYHATSHANAGKILREGFRIPQNDWGHFYAGSHLKQPGSLGYGTYGFLEDKQLAGEFWASMYKSLSRYDIMRVEIEYRIGNSLNFVDNLEDMKYFREFLKDPFFHSGINNLHTRFKNTFRQHALDGALIEYYIKNAIQRGWFHQIDCVCCATSTNVYDRMNIFLPNGIEYCIRNKDIITRISIRSD